ncbi:MAG: hypothetical protein SFY67_16830 [Candidatus Melainabacteria bacterium]|nr:hypothetical protein [Candidatus Melainabacteria bacterium]
MKEPRRPANLPKEAKWNSSDECWQLGKYSNKPKFKNVGVGEWRYWAKEGHLCCIANFNDEGAQDGITERFHPDGTSANRGEWKNGSRHGHFVYTRCKGESNEDYLASYDTWRYEFDSENNWSESNERWYLEDGTECTSDGRPLATAFDLDEIILASSPENFLEKYAKNISTAFGTNDEQALLKNDIYNLAEIWGLSQKDNIKDINQFASYAVEGDNFTKQTSRRVFEENIWRTIINHPWENKHEELGALFMNAVKLGNFGDSDAVYATIMHPRRNEPIKNAVYYWSHDTWVIDEIIAPDLDAFAYRIAVASACHAERLSKPAAEIAWNKLAGKADIGYFASAGLKDEHNLNANLDPVNDLRGPFWRADWICYLLDADDERDMDYVKEAFYANWNKAYDEAQVEERIQTGLNLPSVAMYILWRFFFFAQDDRLKKAKDAFRNHSAKIIRDLVQLLDDIEAKKSGLKNIKDIFAVRKTFLALDLCPERGSARASEASAKAVEEKNRLENFDKEISTIVQNKYELIKLAWKHVEDPALMSQIEKHARKIQGYEMQWKAFDWAISRGYERSNQTLTQEAFAVGMQLAKIDTFLIQPFIFSKLYSDDIATPEVFLVPICQANKNSTQLISACVAALDIVEKYNHKKELAVKILDAIRVSSNANHFSKIIEQYFAQMKNLSDTDIHLKTIAWDTLLIAVCQALSHLPINEIEDCERKKICLNLKQLLDHCIKHYQWNIAGEALEALIAFNEIKVLDSIKRILNSSSDDTALSAALRAIESIAEKMNPKERKLFAAIEFRNPKDHDNQITLLYWRAHNALVKADPKLGEIKDMNAAIDECFELSNYSDGWKLWRLTLCKTIADFPETNIELLKPFLISENQILRESAEKAYAKRKDEECRHYQASWMDIWRIEAKTKDKDAQVDSICNLLKDEKTVERACLAFWLDQNPSAKGAAALCTVVGRLLELGIKPERGEYTSCEMEWMARALISHAAIKEAKDMLDLCLKSGDESLERLIQFEIEGSYA